MISPYDFHSHSTFCDGENSLEEMVQSAIDKGLTHFGFSGHSYTHFDLECCIKKEEESLYFAKCRMLKEKYKDKITILCGIERDIFSDNSYPDLDYIIGSVHYLKVGDDKYLAVDMDKETQIKGVQEYFNGDYLSFCEAYFETVAKLCDFHKTDIVGHFDLVKLYNGDGKLFDENHPRYLTACKKAVDALIKKDVLFEVNTGGMYRNRRIEPYPGEKLLTYIAQQGGKIILNADCHSTESIAYGFYESLELAKKCGFRSIYTLTLEGKKELVI